MDLEGMLSRWAIARKALDKSDQELRIAQAGHEVAVRCEREAWEEMEKLRPPTAAPPPVATAPTKEQLGEMVQDNYRRMHEVQMQNLRQYGLGGYGPISSMGTSQWG